MVKGYGRFGQKCIKDGCSNYSAEWNQRFVSTPDGPMCFDHWTEYQREESRSALDGLKAHDEGAGGSE